MASALSLTVEMVASMSVLLTARIASRSLMSSRPMMDWFSLMLMAGAPWGSGGGEEAGEDERPHEAADGLVVGEPHAVGRAARVAEDDAGDPLGGQAGLGDVATEVGREEGAAEGAH